MKIHFRFFLSHVQLNKKQEKDSFIEFLLPILLPKTRQRQSFNYDKCFPGLCHKLIHEIATIHSINGETCDKIGYVIYICSSVFVYFTYLTFCMYDRRRIMVPTDHDIPFSRTFQGLLRYIFKDFSRTFLCSFKHPFAKK